MKETVLTINAGSSSLKAALYARDGLNMLATAVVERIGSESVFVAKMGDGSKIQTPENPLTNHLSAIHAVIDAFSNTWPDITVMAVGHRVVHGADLFNEPIVITPSVISQLETLSALAPLHQPHNLAGIRAAMCAFPAVSQVACFDTAFHRNHPWVNDTFALPREFYDKGVRRYGFHGLSYDYVSHELARIAPSIASGRVVVAHLGNGASMCAMHNGRSIASTMGFSALDGLPMGTRCGQLDPGVLLYLIQQHGMSAGEIEDVLYRKSGLLGLSGISNDMRTLEASHEQTAKDAIEYFVFRCQREIGAMTAALGGIDALIFCGGIGENSSFIRARICERLAWIGIEIEYARNTSHQPIISSDLARTQVMLIPTNEELVIARAALEKLPSSIKA
jgi:acetate kinase